MDIKIRDNCFGAKFIKSTRIKSFDEKTRSYIDKRASIVEIEPSSRDDVMSVNKAVDFWDNDSYGTNIANALNTLRLNRDYNSKDKIIALTTQSKQLDKLESDNIQGLMEIYKSGMFSNIFYLQVNPDLIYTIKPPKYKNVGSELVKSVQDEEKNEIYLYSNRTAEKFYEKLGFSKVEGTESEFKWVPNKKNIK